MEEINRKQELVKEIVGTIEKMFELALDKYSIEELEKELQKHKIRLQQIEELTKILDNEE